MKSVALLCWIGFLALNGFGQKNRLFKSIEETIGIPADSVYRLDLSKSKITTLPQEVLQFTNLQELYLSKNKLTTLPDNFYFPNLTTLDISQNKLTAFPSVICKNTSLKQLFLNKNKLTVIPPCISELKELIVFEAWFNAISDLPETFVELRKLRFVDLQGVTYSKKFQDKWRKAMPWVKFEFNTGCDCNN